MHIQAVLSGDYCYGEKGDLMDIHPKHPGELVLVIKGEVHTNGQGPLLMNPGLNPFISEWNRQVISRTNTETKKSQTHWSRWSPW